MRVAIPIHSSPARVTSISENFWCTAATGGTPQTGQKVKSSSCHRRSGPEERSPWSLINSRRATERGSICFRDGASYEVGKFAQELRVYNCYLLAARHDFDEAGNASLSLSRRSSSFIFLSRGCTSTALGVRFSRRETKARDKSTEETRRSVRGQ